MYISELDLHGFKSFAHKTKVKFDSGITAIVGPNGCGKSNIVDALRWVLGEQRPTLLRSSSMSNVIFNGTAQKKALGMAEVSLTLVNNKGVLPTEYSEVTITRRLYRSGESEYQLNNTACRLKDIMELFMDTGMGSDAYSVIELKMVEEILNDKNNDRRRLFEEAAGVTRYKEKRRQTFRKLDETLKDLQRIEDILVEVRKKARSLELQAEKAVRHRNFRKELEQLDKAYTKGEYLNVQEELNPLQERVDHAAKEKKEIQSALDKLEENEEQIRQKLLEKERTESETRKRVNQVENSARDLETTLKITREKIENEKGVIHRYREDVKQSHTDLKELTKLKDQHGNKLEDLTREVERSEASLKESRKSFNDIQQTYTQIRHQLYELEIESGNTNQRLSDLRADRIRLESRLENTEGDLNRILSDIREFESEISTLQEELTLIENQKREKEEECQRQKSHLEEQSQKRIRLADSREELKETIRTLKSEGDALRSEQQLLQELANSKEFFPTGVAWLMEHHAGSFKRLDVVGNVLHTDEEHAAALESALGESIHYVLVESMEDALRAAELLKKHKQGRATFIPVSELQKSYPVEKSSILGVVNVDNSYMPVAQLLLGSTILAENISQAKRLLPAIDNATSAVTAEGDILFSRSFYRSGSRGQQSGARLGLKDKLEKLELAIEGNKSELKKKDRTLQKLEQELEEIDLDKLRGRLESAEGELRKKEQAAQRIQSNIQHYKKSIGDLQNRQESLTTSESSARNELETLNPREDELRQEIQELNRLQEEKKEQLQKLEDERAIAQNRYNDARLSHQDVENQSENLKKDLKRTENGIVTIHQRLKSREELTRQSEKKISEFNLALEKAEESLSVKRQQQTELADQLREAEKRTQQQRGEIRDLEVELKKLRRKKEVNLELHHHLEMAREKLEMQAQSLSDHIWQTYGVLMKQIEESLPEEMEPDETKKRIAYLKQRLNQIGEVNPLAIEEFEEESERLEFLEEQVGDLQNAESQLRETIHEINETANKHFNETFEQIRTNFISVFGTLFQEDDYCDLLIDQESEDPLEAQIEIKANPRGKRPSSINQLSGGEKTLTAIALLFAIYLVKPSPFCVLDEVDAPLDDANIDRFANMIRNFSKETQFIIITHNKKTMSKAEMMYGVTMPDIGISKLVGVKLDEVASA